MARLPGAALTVDGNTYTMDVFTGATQYDATGTIMEARADLKAGSTFTVTREFDTGSSADYSFNSNYMMGAYWFLNTDIIDPESTNLTVANAYNQGYVVVGFDTAGADIAETGNATFMGSGQGYYGDVNNYLTVDFDVTAIVDFANRNVDFSTHNTTHPYVALDLSYLNIASTMLTYEKGSNNISGNITLTTGTGANEVTMNGTANARFYGCEC